MDRLRRHGRRVTHQDRREYLRTFFVSWSVPSEYFPTHFAGARNGATHTSGVWTDRTGRPWPWPPFWPGCLRSVICWRVSPAPTNRQTYGCPFCGRPSTRTRPETHDCPLICTDKYSPNRQYSNPRLFWKTTVYLGYIGSLGTEIPSDISKIRTMECVQWIRTRYIRNLSYFKLWWTDLFTRTSDWDAIYINYHCHYLFWVPHWQVGFWNVMTISSFIFFLNYGKIIKNVKKILYQYTTVTNTTAFRINTDQMITFRQSRYLRQSRFTCNLP